MSGDSEAGTANVTEKGPRVRGVEPSHAVPGGRMHILGEGFDPARAHEHRVFFGDRRAQVTRVSETHISAIVPSGAMPEVQVNVAGRTSAPFGVSVATTLAEELQPVANPAFDREGNLYVTLSGSRGEKVPVSIFRVEPDGEVMPVSSEIVNPTGLAWGPDDCLYVSSRQDGSVYRILDDRQVQLLSDELGIATGIAFDREGILYVGDRRGTIFRIEPNGEPRSFCHLEPSVAAYHLAFDAEGVLFVTAPSLAPVDPIYRVNREGEVDIFVNGFGRPQGLAFDSDGNLYVAEGLAGDSGLYRISPVGEAEKIASAPPLVGVAFDGKGGIILAGGSSVFQLEIGISGLLL
ncbi:MAG: IPT/TIG domain-containing protein [Vicinamibacteria bacterium]